MTKADKVRELAESAMKRMAQSARNPGDNQRIMTILRKFRKDTDEFMNPPKKGDTAEPVD